MKIYIVLAITIAVYVEARPQHHFTDLWTSLYAYPTGNVYPMKYDMLPTPFEPYDPGFAFPYGYPPFYPGEAPMTQLPNGNWLYLPGTALVTEKDKAEKKSEEHKTGEKKPEAHKSEEDKLEAHKSEKKPEEKKHEEKKHEEKKEATPEKGKKH